MHLILFESDASQAKNTACGYLKSAQMQFSQFRIKGLKTPKKIIF